MATTASRAMVTATASRRGAAASIIGPGLDRTGGSTRTRPILGRADPAPGRTAGSGPCQNPGHGNRPTSACSVASAVGVLAV
jgi:hypothetical protein